MSVFLSKGYASQHLLLSSAYLVMVAVLAAVGVRWGIAGVATGVTAASAAWFVMVQWAVWRLVRVGPIQTPRSVAAAMVSSGFVFACLVGYRVLLPATTQGAVWLSGAVAVWMIEGLAAVWILRPAVLRLPLSPSSSPRVGLETAAREVDV